MRCSIILVAGADRVRLVLTRCTGLVRIKRDVLLKASRDSTAVVRQKAAYLMGLHASDKTLARLSEMLERSGAPGPTPSLRRAGPLEPAGFGLRGWRRGWESRPTRGLGRPASPGAR